MYSPRLARTLVAAAVAAICSIGIAATSHADPVKCKAAIIKASATYAQARAKALQKCEDTVVKGKLAQSTVCTTEAKAAATILKAKDKLTATIGKACGGADKLCGGDTTEEDTSAGIGFPGTCPNFESGACNGAVGPNDCTGIATCALCIDDAAVNQAIGLSYAALAPTDPKADKLLNKCQAAIGKAALTFLAAKSKALSKCWGNVNKGKATGPCPTAAEAPKIAAAAAKVSTSILKACAGKDKIIGGTDVNADFTPTQIGFPATCNDVDPLGATPSCSGAVNDLQGLITCVTCVNHFKVDCADAIGASTLSAYPGACNPGPAVATPTPTATATPAASPRPCGNGGDPQLCDPSSAGYACGVDFACTNCNCACPSSVQFSGDATDPASILDTGWTGISHRAPIITNGDVSVNLNCSASQRPCGVCAITGPIANENAGAGQLDNQRCSNDSSLRCTANTTCTTAANTCSGGTNANGACAVTSCAAPGTCTAGTCVGGANAGQTCCNGGSCRPAGTCGFYFGSNLPLAAGGVTTCVVNQFNGQVTGTANVESGEAITTALLTARVYNGIAIDNPCPRCSGDTTVNDGTPGGTCDGGPRIGLTCDGNGSVPGRPDYGTTSLDCPPNPAGIIAALPIDLSNATDPVTKTLTAASPNCTSSSATGDKCLCDTCNNINAEPCDDNADCPDPAGPIGSFCGGRRCLGGTNVGAACTNNTECPGVVQGCGRPGQATAPSGCQDDTTVADRVMECADSNGDGEGECTKGPADPNCTVASGHAQRGCSLDSDCGGAPGSCTSAPRGCFLTGGGTFQAAGQDDGTDTLIANGMEDPPVRDVSHPTLGAVFCVGPTSAAAINNVAGLPGVGRVTIKGTAIGKP